MTHNNRAMTYGHVRTATLFQIYEFLVRVVSESTREAIRQRAQRSEEARVIEVFEPAPAVEPARQATRQAV